MKTKKMIPITLLSLALVAFVGCKKEESSTPPDQTGTTADAVKDATADAKAIADKAAADAKALADKAAAEAKATAEKAAAEAKAVTDAAKAKANDIVSAATAKAQEIIDKATALVNDGKYQDALTALKALANTQLTDSQKQAVADLQAKIQKALASVGNLGTNGTDAVKRLLGN